jgi:ABC-type bacteriocin/lantibiotic exporter with double-glycine peptidase domain
MIRFITITFLNKEKFKIAYNKSICAIGTKEYRPSAFVILLMFCTLAVSKQKVRPSNLREFYNSHQHKYATVSQNFLNCIMKQKISKHFYETISGIRIFRDDIDELLQWFQNKSLVTKIHDSSSVYENIEEVINFKGNNPKQLALEGESESKWESVTISIEKEKVSISSTGSEAMYAFGFELKDYFLNRVPWHYKVFNPWIFFILIPVSTAILQIFIDDKTKNLRYPWLWWIFVTVTLFLIISIVNRYFGFGLTLTRKHEYGFWKRNKDKILLTILGALIGSALTLFFQWVQKHSP